MKKLKLLLIGATVFQKNSEGKLTAKRLVVDYVHGFAKYFKKVIWATTFEGEAHTQAIIDDKKVIPCILVKGPKGLFYNFQKLYQFVDQETIIFLHLPNPWNTPGILLLKLKAKGLFVYVAGDYIMHIEISKKTRGLFYAKLYKFIYELPIRFADGVIVRGKLNFKRACKLNKNVIETVPIGLNRVFHKRTKKPFSGESITLLYVGKLEEGKGVHVLLRAFAKLTQRIQNKDISLIVAGTGPEEGNLKSLATSLGIAEKVNFLGFVDDKYELSKLYAEADALIVPSSTHPEGVPRVINEALLHNTPVISTAVGGIPEEFKRGEIIMIPPSDVASLENALYDLISSKNILLEQNDSTKQHHYPNSVSPFDQHAQFIIDITCY